MGWNEELTCWKYIWASFIDVFIVCSAFSLYEHLIIYVGFFYIYSKNMIWMLYFWMICNLLEELSNKTLLKFSLYGRVHMYWIKAFKLRTVNSIFQTALDDLSVFTSVFTHILNRYSFTFKRLSFWPMSARNTIDLTIIRDHQLDSTFFWIFRRILPRNKTSKNTWF